MTECNKCGDCCKVIPFNYTKKELKSLDAKSPSDIATIKFVLKYWHRINKSEARKINPGLQFGKQYAYTCDKWDKETKLCMAHDERPPICSNFPWYGEAPKREDQLDYLPNCSFREDIPVAFISKV